MNIVSTFIYEKLCKPPTPLIIKMFDGIQSSLNTIQITTKLRLSIKIICTRRFNLNRKPHCSNDLRKSAQSDHMWSTKSLNSASPRTIVSISISTKNMKSYDVHYHTYCTVATLSRIYWNVKRNQTTMKHMATLRNYFTDSKHTLKTLVYIKKASFLRIILFCCTSVPTNYKCSKVQYSLLLYQLTKFIAMKWNIQNNIKNKRKKTKHMNKPQQLHNYR